MDLPGLFPPTGVGSLPHEDPDRAVRAVLSGCPTIPYWPQLPRRTFLENMYIQYGAGLPASELSGEKLLVEYGDAMMAGAEEFYSRFLSGDTGSFAIPKDRAAGLARFLEEAPGTFPAVKGQVTGPVSFGLMVTDRGKRPLYYDPMGRDILVKHLLRVAQWQVGELARLSPNVILVVDEPYLASLGSAVLSLSREEVVASLDEIFEGLQGALCGIHCCANTDWGLVLSTKVRYLSFDAFEYADSLLLYAGEVAEFLGRGGKLAFGIVPTSREGIARETPETLAGRMEAILRKFAERGIPEETVGKASLVTPACGLGTVPEEDAERAILLAADLSALLRGRYGKDLP
jgi:methionine synthase II (cobalamin-independent)